MRRRAMMRSMLSRKTNTASETLRAAVVSGCCFNFSHSMWTEVSGLCIDEGSLKGVSAHAPRTHTDRQTGARFRILKAAGCPAVKARGCFMASPLKAPALTNPESPGTRSCHSFHETRLETWRKHK